MVNNKIIKFGEYVIKKKNYMSINENQDPNLDKDKERIARIKVNKALLWINVRRGFFGRLLGNLNIYGSSSLDPKTMATNGLHIVYHPDFVMSQSPGAIRFVLCHEILHCLGDHMSRRGGRDPYVWNVACDYAINPILDAEISGDSGFEWPKNEDGSRMGLYEAKYAGMKAEEIYDILVKENPPSSPGGPPQLGKIGKDFDEVTDKDLPGPDSGDSIVQDVRMEEGDEGEGSSGGSGGEGEESEESEDEGKSKGGEGEGEGEGDDGSASIIGKKITVTAGPYKGQTGIVKEVLANGDIII